LEDPNDDLVVVFTNLTFQNITFRNSGNLMNLDHLMNSQLIIQDSYFYDLDSAGLLIASSSAQESGSKTKVKIINTKFDNFESLSGSIISVYEGSVVEIQNWTFTNLSTMSNGAVIFAGNRQADISIYDSSFMNNSAFEGAIFNIEQESIVKWHNWTISNNYAIKSGVVKINTNGYFEFYNTVITKNYAKNNPISLLLDWVNISIFNNCTIYDNAMVTIDEAVEEFSTGWSKLCFIGQNLKNFIIDYTQHLNNEPPTSSLIQLIFASVKISNSSHIYSQSSIVKAFLSTITIENSTINDISMTESAIEGVSSTIEFSKMTINNITSSEQGSFIVISLNSHFIAKNVEYNSGNWGLFDLRSSEIDVEDVQFDGVKEARFLFDVYDSEKATLDNITVSNSSSEETSLVKIRNSKNVSWSNISFSDIDQIAIYIEESFLTKMKNISVSDSQKAFLIKNSQIDMIRDSTFLNNGKRANYKGGAIEMMDSHISIVNSTFINNTAESGGGIYFDWSSLSLCDLVVSNSTFELNRATNKGGGIFYNYKRPTLTSINNVNNSAFYGPDLASYAVKIRMQGSNSDSMVLNDVGPNVVIGKFSLELLDYDNQVMVLNNINQIVISSINSNEASIQGTNAALLREGVGTFDLLKSLAVPGTRGAKMRASSKAINSAKIIQVYGSLISDNLITFNFRNCTPGEHIQNTNRWVQWSVGTYSLKWNSLSCILCIDDATCEGGEVISVDKEFWRYSTNSTKVVECLHKSACEGGYFPQNNHPVSCKEGYEGILCLDCQIVNGVKYQRMSGFGWSKCMNTALNTFSVAAVILLVFWFFMVLIVINARKTKESKSSVMLRILTNYIQFITLSFSYSSKFPATLLSFLLPIERLGSSTDTFLSFDWFVEDYELRAFFPSNAFLKIFLIGFLPIILTAIVSIIWIVVHFVKRKWASDLKRWIMISFITIVFIMHPKLTEKSLGMFKWVEIDDGKSRVLIDTNISCYSYEHFHWIVVLAFPIITVWVVGAPLTAFVLLYKNIKKGDSNKVNQYLLILYQGLKHDKFYWEFVNTIRKTIFLALLILRDTPKIFFGIVFLVLTARLQSWLTPFKDEENNRIEIHGLTASMIILTSALVFQEEHSMSVFNTIAVIVILGFNISFIIEWLYKLCTANSERYKFAKHVSKMTFTNIILHLDG
jgi:hypothetical protein